MKRFKSILMLFLGICIGIGIADGGKIEAVFNLSAGTVEKIVSVSLGAIVGIVLFFNL